MKYTAGQAAEAAGISKATITRALKSGKISGIKDDSGAWIIDPAELHRVFPPVADEPSETRIMQQPATHEKPNETGLLERENQMLREALAEARQEQDRWHQIAERLSIAPRPLRQTIPSPLRGSGPGCSEKDGGLKPAELTGRRVAGSGGTGWTGFHRRSEHRCASHRPSRKPRPRPRPAPCGRGPAMRDGRCRGW